MRLTNAVFAVAFATIIALGPAHAVCTNASVVGSYGAILYQGEGYAIHLFHYAADGNGGLSASETRSVGGTIETKTFTGTYTVSTNCTGSFMLTISGGGSGTYAFVIDHSRKGLEIMETDSSYNTGGSALAQGTVPCGLTGKSQTVALNLAGVDGANKINTVGLVKLSGTGTLSGTVTFSLSGAINQYSVKGTYSVNADCTGTAQLIGLPSSSPANFALVSINGGTEWLMLETDTNTMVSGLLAQ